jgi:eukaryotic-like serine/threonine-protein kinase
MKPQDPFIGRDILDGQFQIVQKIGAGGMGTVYKALQPEMSRMVAVKILHPKLTARKDIASRFRREARALSHLTHPNTVRVLMYGELDDGPLYIVMEYLEGKNLNQLVRLEGHLQAKRVVPMLVQAASALDEAHKAGIIHRDLKPENIFVCKQGGLVDFVKVLDFGLAKVTQREMRPGSVMLTQEGMIFGTPEFMSPEQAQGVSLTAASDIYSLAVILYEALTGKLPFEAKTPMEYLQMHVSAPPIPLAERGAGGPFPPGLWPVLEKAMAKDPAHRYQTCLEFGDALLAACPPGNLAGTGSGGALKLPAAEASSPAIPKAEVSETRMGGRAAVRSSPLIIEGERKDPRSLLVAAACAFVLGVIATILVTRTLHP